MPPVRALVVDFDGTISLRDAGVELLQRFGNESRRAWLAEIDEAFDAGAIGLRTVLEAEAASLVAPREDLIAFAIDRSPIDPTFVPFVAWARAVGLSLTVVSDGFGIHVRPMLAEAGVGDLPVITNDLADGRLTFGGPHPTCVGCGTCKKQAVERDRAAHGAVAFVGDGVSDRFGARYADLVFAKDALADHCRVEGIPFAPFDDFDDVRRTLETITDVPGPAGGEPCPGWREPT